MSLQPLKDHTVQQVQLMDIAGQTASAPSHSSSGSNEAQAQPKRTVHAQPLAENGCKGFEAETAGTLQQVQTVPQPKKGSKYETHTGWGWWSGAYESVPAGAHAFRSWVKSIITSC